MKQIQWLGFALAAMIFARNIHATEAASRDVTQAPSTKAQSTYHHNGKALTKLEAILTLARDPSADVERCTAVELTKEGTLRNKKVAK
jgi:hypothetical protein